MSDYDPVQLASGLRDRLLALNVGPVVVGPLVNAADLATGLQPYPLSDDIGSGQILLGVQVNMRDTATAGVAGLLARQEKIYRSMVALQGATVNGIPVVTTWRQSSAGPTGLDDQGRPRIADTYWLRSDRSGFAG
jgi:hypothetical protein